MSLKLCKHSGQLEFHTPIRCSICRLEEENENLKMDNANKSLYFYKVSAIRVIDGDTIECTQDFGCDILVKKRKFRLFAINTPELRGPEKAMGYAAKDFLSCLIVGAENPDSIMIQTIKDKQGKYGRYLAILYIDGVDINEKLINSGHAVVAEY